MTAALNDGTIAWQGEVVRGTTTLEQTLRGLAGR
jgi:hypothetical protein